jgi:predicted anti-sigma-YlaC factor YlaD
MKIRRTCRDVTRLVLEGEDRRLPLADRLVVRLHLTACDGCTRFVSQVGLMRGAMQRWRAYGEDGDEPKR